MNDQTANTAVLDQIQDHVQKIKSGDSPVRPGEPVYITEAWGVNDGCWQGDLGVCVQDPKSVPAEYVEVRDFDPTSGLKLVWEAEGINTDGASHILKGQDGKPLKARVLRSPSWNADSLVGPFIMTTEPAVIEHPKHGHVFIPKDTCVEITYQREFDKELAQERRSLD